MTNSRSVIITGALTGIGRAAAHAFALQGGNLVIAGRHPAAGAEVAAELRALDRTSNLSRPTSASKKR
jgi:NAD(P)-dependent dehydrogenase (short-subunit alcohol dehydrogenase family)